MSTINRGFIGPGAPATQFPDPHDVSGVPPEVADQQRRQRQAAGLLGRAEGLAERLPEPRTAEISTSSTAGPSKKAEASTAEKPATRSDPGPSKAAAASSPAPDEDVVTIPRDEHRALLKAADLVLKDDEQRQRQRVDDLYRGRQSFARTYHRRTR